MEYIQIKKKINLTMEDIGDGWTKSLSHMEVIRIVIRFMVLMLLLIFIASCAPYNINKHTNSISKSFPNGVVYTDPNHRYIVIVVDTVENRVYQVKSEAIFSEKITNVVLLKRN